MSMIIRPSIATELEMLNQQYESYSKSHDSNKRIEIFNEIGKTLSTLVVMTSTSQATRFEDHVLHQKVFDIWNSLFGKASKGNGTKQLSLDDVEIQLKKIGDLFNSKFRDKSDGILHNISYDAQLISLSFLSFADIRSISLTSKGGYRIVRDEAIWNAFCQQVGITLDPSTQNSYQIFKDSQINYFYQLFNSFCGQTEIEKSNLMPLILKELKTEHPEKLPSNSVANRFFNGRALRITTKDKQMAWPHSTWDWIWEKLKNLTAISVFSNKLSFFPSGMSHLKLNGLNFADNQFSKFPSHLNMEYMTEINLQKNLFSEFPMELLQALRLKKLNLSENPIGSLPEEICTLSELETLNVSNACLEEIPETLWQLNNLGYLILDNNQISELSESVGKLEHLFVLKIKNNKLKTLPSNLLKNRIKVINVELNPIESLPNFSTSLELFLDFHIDAGLPSDAMRSLELIRNLGAIIHFVKRNDPSAVFFSCLTPPTLETRTLEKAVPNRMVSTYEPPRMSAQASAIIESESKHRTENSKKSITK